MSEEESRPNSPGARADAVSPDDDTPDDSASQSVDVPEVLGSISDRQCQLEVITVILLSIFPDIFNSLATYFIRSRQLPYEYTTLQSITNSTRVAAPVLYVIWRDQEGWGKFGIRKFRLIIDSVWAVFVFVIVKLSKGALVQGTPFINLLNAYDPNNINAAGVFTKPTGHLQSLLLIVSSITNGFSQELVMRGFLIPRIHQMLRSRMFSVLISALLYCSYHAHQGIWGLFSAFIFGLVFGAFFCWKRRLWPLVIAHAMIYYAGFARA